MILLDLMSNLIIFISFLRHLGNVKKQELRNYCIEMIILIVLNQLISH